MKWLVTGARGFLGQAMTRYLRAAGLDMVFLEHEGKRVDLLQQQALQKCLERTRPTAILHLAGRHGRNISSLEFERCHVEATLNLLQAASPGLERWISVGSAAEYGLTPCDDRWQETSLCTPQSDYGRSKLKQTQAIQDYCQANSIPWVVFRAFNVFGPHQRPGLLIPDTLARLRSQSPQSTEKIEVNSGHDVRDFVPVDLLCQILLGLIQNKEAVWNYNVCSGQGTSVTQITSWLADELGFTCPIEQNPETSNHPPTFSVGDPSRIQHQLGQKWSFDLEFEIRRLARQRKLRPS